MSQHVLDSIDPKLLGKRLAESRRVRRLPPQQVADELSFSRPTVIAMEKGKRRPKARELVALAKLFDQPVWNFQAQEVSAGESGPADFYQESWRSKPLDDSSMQSAVRAFEEAKLTEGQLAELLDIDRLGTREIVNRSRGISVASMDSHGICHSQCASFAVERFARGFLDKLGMTGYLVGHFNLDMPTSTATWLVRCVATKPPVAPSPLPHNPLSPREPTPHR